MSKRRRGTVTSPQPMPERRPSAADRPPASNDVPGTSRLSWDTVRRILPALLIASVILSVLFALRVELDGNPDEKAHLDYIRLIIEERGFVRFVAGDQERFETHQPPLYYLVAVPVYLASGGNLIAVRLVAAVMQLLTILVAWRACRDLFPERPDIGLAVPAFVAFLPTQAQLSGAVNNDALTTLLCTAMFWRLGLLVVRGQTVRDAAFLGLLLGLGLLTKLSVLQLLPGFLVAYGLAVRSRRMDIGQAGACLGLALTVGVVVASPWLARNHLLYGDPLTLKIYTSTGPNFTPEKVQEAAGWSAADYLRQVGVRSYATFWYFLPPDLPFRRFTGDAGPLLLALVLGVGGLLGTARDLLRGEPTNERRVLLLFILSALLLVPFFTRFVLTVFQAQGRYFLPALFPIAVVCCWGWSALAGRARLAGALGAVGVLLLLTLFAVGGGSFG